MLWSKCMFGLCCLSCENATYAVLVNLTASTQIHFTQHIGYGIEVEGPIECERSGLKVGR